MNFLKKLKKLKGDASSRVFYRKKDKKLNLLNYDSINKILIKNNVAAPKLLSENYSKNYIEIQDFGDETIFKLFNKKINQKNDTFVHRDFHISNLMMLKNDIGIIDSQDALIGNKAYDLASLIDDVRFETSFELKKKIYNFYLKTKKKLNKKSFKNDFEIISVLRNLKIIGIFTRLAVRDNKKKYLKLIPYAWKLIRLRSQNDNFRDLNNLLKVLKKNK